MKENTNPLGQGDVKKLLVSLAIPAIIGQIVSLLYNMVDRIFIGHIPEVGGLALTGVGLTTPLLIIIAAFSALIGMGGAPRAAIKMGEEDYEDAEKIMGNCFTGLVLISIILTGFFLYFNEDLLRLFGASDKTLPYALEYMEIYTLGTVFVQITIGLNPFISTQGFSTMSMVTVLIGAIINIVLDPIFIYVFNMGVKGAALATIISQGISALWVLIFLSGKRTNIRLKSENLGLDKKVMLPVLALGLSPFVMNITESLINIVFNRSLQKFGGDAAVGAMTIFASAMQFTFLPLTGLTQGAQPIISYNYGAKNGKRVEEAFKLLFLASITYSSLFWLFLMLKPLTFVGIFTSDASILKIGSSGLRIYMAGAFMLGAQLACQQTFIALGNAKTSLFLAILRKIILLVPLVLILPKIFTTNKVFAVFAAEPVADIIAALVTSLIFFSQFKTVLESMETSDEEDRDELYIGNEIKA